jgi:regulator of sigma E protease
MSGLIFIVILSFLVIIHELGHFLVARWAKIKVEEFGLGYPPKMVRLFTDKKGTEYTLNWLPFGGFVRMFGEDGVVQSRDLRSRDYAFSAVPAWKRMVVILAGATVNFAFGVVAFGAIYSQHGIPTDLEAVRIEGVAAGSPAEMAAVPVGSMITGLEINEEQIEVKTGEDLITAVGAHRGETVRLTTDQGVSYEVYVRKAEEVPEGQGALGVTLTDFEMRFYPWWQMPFRGMWVGLKAAVSFGGLILESLGTMLKELITMGQVPADVAGPVGIVYQAEKEGFLREGFWSQLNFAAILSINLAIINVLPFPALDGGRGFFLAIEMLLRKRIKPQIEQWVNSVGFLLLIGLIVLISARDIGRVISDQGIQQWFWGLIGR